MTWPALCVAAIFVTSGCTRRQLVPGIIAGTGAALTTSGGIYRATLETDEPFGETPGEVAGTTILIFGGLGLLLTGVIWSLTSTHCEDNGDCWSRDVCELRTHTCIDGDAARRLHRRAGQPEERGDEVRPEGEEEPETAEPETPETDSPEDDSPASADADESSSIPPDDE